MKFSSYVMAAPETNLVELEIEKLVYGGLGLARLQGQVVLAPFVLPGERVRAELTGGKPRLLEARVSEVLAPAAERVEPPCPHFFRCGGCQYQHAAYEEQLRQKREILREVLRRVGKLEAPDEIGTIAGPPWRYRNRTQLHLAAGRVGYFELGSHRLVDIERCPISSEKINEAIAGLRSMLADRRFPRFVSSLELFTNERELQLNVLEAAQPVSRRFFDWAAERLPGLASDAIEYTVGEDLFRVRHRSFFQANRFLLEPLIECALEGAAGETALDLYAGVGLFSLPLARRFAQVTAVESGGSAAGDLEFNAERAGLRIAVERGRAEGWLAALDRAPDFVLADPPRAGLGAGAVRELLRLQPPRLVIVACDPATLARDLSALTAGGYRLDALTLVDLFPQTYHIETVARLLR